MNENASFTAGDVVQLKSGGPPMTVCGKSATTGDVLCIWFEKTKKHDETFPTEVLKRASRRAVLTSVRRG